MGEELIGIVLEMGQKLTHCFCQVRDTLFEMFSEKTRLRVSFFKQKEKAEAVINKCSARGGNGRQWF